MYIGYMMQFLLKIFRSVQNLLSAELPDSRGIFGGYCVIEKWWKMSIWASCTTCSMSSWYVGHNKWFKWKSDLGSARNNSWQEGHSRFEDSTHFYCPCLVCYALKVMSGSTQHTSTALRSLWNGKAISISQAADGARGPRLGWREGHNRFEDYICWKWLMCGCVCVCVHRHLQAGFPKTAKYMWEMT